MPENDAAHTEEMAWVNFAGEILMSPFTTEHQHANLARSLVKTHGTNVKAMLVAIQAGTTIRELRRRCEILLGYSNQLG